MKKTTLFFYRFLASLFRFKSLALMEWLFKNEPEVIYYSIPMFGYTMPINVARSITQKELFIAGERYIVERKLLMFWNICLSLTTMRLNESLKMSRRMLDVLSNSLSNLRGAFALCI